MYNTDDLFLFLKVAELGNFSATAKQLNVSNTTIGRQIKSLEEDLGVSLVIRDTKVFELTNAGKKLYNLIKTELLNIKELSKNLDDKVKNEFKISSEPSGILRVSLAPSIAYSLISEHLPDFVHQYPQIKLSVSYNIKPDIIDDGVDYSISNILPTDANYKIKHLIAIKYQFYCTQKYVDTYGEPHSIDELSQHLVVGTNIKSNSSGQLIYKNVPIVNQETGMEEILSMTDRFLADSLLHNVKFVLSNKAICPCSTFVADELAKITELVNVIPEYVFTENYYSVRHPHNNDKAVAAFAQFIEKIFEQYRQ